MSGTVSNTFNPRNFYWYLGTYQITGFENGNSGAAFESEGNIASLSIGMGAFTKMYAANHVITVSINLMAGHPDNNIIAAYNVAAFNANNGLLPSGIANGVNAAADTIPFFIFAGSAATSTFQFTSRAWVITNAVSVTVPYDGSNTYTRKWNFQFGWEAQDLLGALITG